MAPYLDGRFCRNNAYSRIDSASLSLEGFDMPKAEKSRYAAAQLAARACVLANAAVRAFNALAADRALAQRAATAAALPRQRLTELRALYTTHESVPASARVDEAARSPAFELFSVVKIRNA